MEQGKLKREITILHGVLLIVGSVIGASAFILIGPLAGQTGPGLWISYAIGAIPALFVAVVFSQLGAAFPITGAGYISISRLLSPSVAMMVVWSAILGIFAFAMPLMAFGFALYLDKLFPLGGDAMLLVVAALTIMFFTVLNMFEIKWMLWVQSIMAGIMIIALIIFGVGGSLNANPSYQTPLFPLGFSAVLAAMIPAYVMYTGLNGATELGGETKNPRRSIPIILAISLTIMVAVYILITYALTGLLPWQELGKIKGATAIVTAAGKFMPAGVALWLMGIGALFAAATTISGSLAFFIEGRAGAGQGRHTTDETGQYQQTQRSAQSGSCHTRDRFCTWTCAGCGLRGKFHNLLCDLCILRLYAACPFCLYRHVSSAQENAR